MLAVDLGRKRVGLAVSDPMGVIAQPLRSEPAEPEASLAERLAAVVAEVGAEEVVVGLPRRLDGSRGPEAKAAQQLAAELRRRTRLRISLADERLTSVAAERSLLEAGVKRAGRKRLSDEVAATLILQSYLDSTRGR